MWIQAGVLLSLLLEFHCTFLAFMIVILLISSPSWNVCFKSSAGVAVEEFGHEKEHGALFVKTLLVLTTSEAMAAMTTSYSCDQEPELAEAYFGLLSTFVRSCPHVRSFLDPVWACFLFRIYNEIAFIFSYCRTAINYCFNDIKLILGSPLFARCRICLTWLNFLFAELLLWVLFYFILS